MLCIKCSEKLSVVRTCRKVELCCRFCGARFNLNDYYNHVRMDPSAEAELERQLANIPVNRL